MRPSKALRDGLTQAIGEGDYLAGIKKDIEVAQAVEQGMSSIFGAAIFEALEESERAAYHTMANTSPLRIGAQMEARAELKVAQYIKSRLSSRVMNVDAMLANLKQLQGDYNDEA